MMMSNVESILEKYNGEVQELALRLRAFVLERLEGITEIPDAAAGLIGYGYGKGYKHLICTILLSKKGVKLGLWKGAQLPDPDHLLAGTGKVHRYVAISRPADIDDPALARLLLSALHRYRSGK